MVKRKREEERPPVEAALVKVEYGNLPPESRQHLNNLMQQWKEWHKQKFPEGYNPPEVFSGALRYEPRGVISNLPSTVLPVLDDRPAIPEAPITRNLWFNIQYERAGDVPSYRRAIDAPINAPTATKRRQVHVVRIKPAVPAAEGGEAENNGDVKNNTAAEVEKTANGDTVPAAPAVGVANGDGISLEVAPFQDKEESVTVAPSAPAAKRLRSGQQCFNCGSYAHTLRECWKQMDYAAIAQARHAAGWFGVGRVGGGGGGGGGGGAYQRYFVDAVEGKKKKLKNKSRKKARKAVVEEQEERSDASSDFEDEKEEDEVEKVRTEGNGDSSRSSSSKEEEESEDEEDEDLTEAEKLQREFSHIVPGALSSKLRNALGIGPLDAPPWLTAMRAMGLPPAYTAAVANAGEGLVGKKEVAVVAGGSGKLLVIEDRGGGAAAGQLEEGEYTEDNGPEKEKEEKADKDADDAITGPVEEFIFFSNEEESADLDRTPGGKKNSTTGAVVLFPGINSPIPEGADPYRWSQGQQTHHQHHSHRHDYHHGPSGASHRDHHQNQYQRRHQAHSSSWPNQEERRREGGGYRDRERWDYSSNYAGPAAVPSTQQPKLLELHGNPQAPAAGSYSEYYGADQPPPPASSSLPPSGNYNYGDWQQQQALPPPPQAVPSHRPSPQQYAPPPPAPATAPQYHQPTPQQQIWQNSTPPPPYPPQSYPQQGYQDPNYYHGGSGGGYRHHDVPAAPPPQAPPPPGPQDHGYYQQYNPEKAPYNQQPYNQQQEAYAGQPSAPRGTGYIIGWEHAQQQQQVPPPLPPPGAW